MRPAPRVFDIRKFSYTLRNSHLVIFLLPTLMRSLLFYKPNFKIKPARYATFICLLEPSVHARKSQGTISTPRFYCRAGKGRLDNVEYSEDDFHCLWDEVIIKRYTCFFWYSGALDFETGPNFTIKAAPFDQPQFGFHCYLRGSLVLRLESRFMESCHLCWDLQLGV